LLVVVLFFMSCDVFFVIVRRTSTINYLRLIVFVDVFYLFD